MSMLYEREEQVENLKKKYQDLLGRRKDIFYICEVSQIKWTLLY